MTEPIVVRKEDLIAEGNTAEVYRVGEDKVLKLFREGNPRIAVEGEYDNSRIAQKTLQNVPRVYDLVETEGRLGIVFQKLEGRDLLEKMIGDPLHLAKYAKEFAGYSASIGQKVSDEMRTVKVKLGYEIEHQTELTKEETEKALLALQAMPDGDRLCHGDFHPGNVMECKDGTYLIDWMTGAKGDPCADAARTLLLLRYGEPMHISPVKLLLIRLGMNRICSVYLKEYCRLTGFDKAKIDRWILPVAAARLCEGMTAHEKQILVKLVRKELSKR